MFTKFLNNYYKGKPHVSSSGEVRRGVYFILIIIFFFFLSRLPYFNLFINKETYSMLFFSIAYVILFRPSQEATVILQLVSLAMAAVFTLLGAGDIAEGFGNVLYVLVGYLAICYVLEETKRRP